MHSDHARTGVTHSPISTIKDERTGIVNVVIVGRASPGGGLPAAAKELLDCRADGLDQGVRVGGEQDRNPDDVPAGDDADQHRRGQAGPQPGRIAPPDKWLRIHNSQEWPDYYDEANVEDLRRFLEAVLSSSSSAVAGVNVAPGRR